jgi:hypothetical protein
VSVTIKVKSLRLIEYNGMNVYGEQTFFREGEGAQQIQLNTEGRENADLRAVAP